MLDGLDFDLVVSWSQDGSKTVLRGLLGGSWVVLGGVLGRSWGLLGPLWRVLGGFWGVLSGSWAALGGFLALLEWSWRPVDIYCLCLLLFFALSCVVDVWCWFLLLMSIVDVGYGFALLVLLFIDIVVFRCWCALLIVDGAFSIVSLNSRLSHWSVIAVFLIVSCVVDCYHCFLCWCHSNPYCWILSSLLIIVFILIVSFWVVLECESLIQFIDSIQWCDSSIRFVHWVEVWFYIMSFTPFDSTTPPGGMREAIKYMEPVTS